MPSPIRTITIDCADPYALAEFWSEVIDAPIDSESRPGADEAYIPAPKGQPGMLFLRVPESKTVKNRVHFDLGPNGAGRDEEMDRLLGIGATFLADFRTPDGRGFVVLADPEGNEFCIERGDEELAAAGDVRD
ncbi:putative enzyme related to lactoylglutathione lyase [Spinactinospora alkalitolerans]|uniref:Putative enzyme related to lactoylglutathione lyase n=1 Tax=Spinactinospora alkalitolerans TaxID=687207 RepID=A0A852TV96_9ACTN|nr:VOC family protein [Spinactinospora alkalitolerans]NYE48396.1 putative enzyme related to lactoylglutathione lyase [Spinactinospora alkalitolerans]